MGKPVDDRGREYEPAHPRVLSGDARLADDRFRAAVRRAGRSIVTASRTSPVLTALLSGTGGVIVLAGMLLFPSVPIWQIGVVALGTPIVLHQLLVRSIGPKFLAWNVDLLLTDGLCPACLYSIHRSGTDESGFVTCPECGSSWRAERILRREGFIEGSPPTWARMMLTSILRGAGSGPGTTNDDRGLQHPVIDPAFQYEIMLAKGARRTTLIDARRHVRKQGRVLRLVKAVWLLSLPGVVIVLGVFVGSGAWIAIGSALMAPIGVIVFGEMRGSSGIRAKSVRWKLLQAELCPRCAADLEGQTPEDDGCVVCRECAAAWRLSKTDPETDR